MQSLPELTREQIKCIEALEAGSNIVVPAVVGSGKTTSMLGACVRLPKKLTAWISYNARLKDESRSKIEALGLQHVEAHSYHSFCVKYYSEACFRDQGIRQLVETDAAPKRPLPAFDLVLIDEAQDMTFIYFYLVRKILRDIHKQKGSAASAADSNSPVQLGVFGDVRQSIYSFNDACDAYLRYADRGIFDIDPDPTHPRRPWEKCSLSTSYRLSLPMANFINKCIVRQPLIQTLPPTASSSSKGRRRPAPALPVLYMVCDAFSDPLRLVLRYLNQKKYQPSDIFILAPSLRSANSPIRKLENALVNKGFPCYCPGEDVQEVDERVTRGKVVFCSWHQVKGLERPLVVVFQFDETYFQFYARDESPYQCPNAMYVALTRAKQELIVVHHHKHAFCPFVDVKQIEHCCKLQILRPFTTTSNKNDDDDNQGTPATRRQREWSVTDLLRHQPPHVLDDALQRMGVTLMDLKSGSTSSDKEEPIQLTGIVAAPSASAAATTVATELSETVADLYGLAVAALYEQTILRKPCTILRHTYSEKGSLPTAHRAVVSGWWANSPSTLCPRDLVYCANLYDSLQSGYIGRREQIKNYDFVDESRIRELAERIGRRVGFPISSSDSNRTIPLRFEVPLSRDCGAFRLSGRMDIVVDEKDKTIWELKCTKGLDREHLLQALCYRWLATPDFPKHQMRLYNVCSDDEVRFESMKGADAQQAIEFLFATKQQVYKPRLPKEVVEVMSSAT